MIVVVVVVVVVIVGGVVVGGVVVLVVVIVVVGGLCLQVFFSISFSRMSLSGCQKSWAIWPKHFLGRSDI